MSDVMLVTLRFRLRDKHVADLNRQARAVNVVWNYCNETQQKAARSHRPWLTAIDLQRLTAGSSKLLDLHAHTVQQVCRQYERSRSALKRPWLRFRGKKSLGWVPFNQGHVQVVGDRKLKFRGKVYETMHWREIPQGAVCKAGSFCCDSLGRWYINFPVEMPLASKATGPSVGVDLGLKDLATLSTGQVVENPRHFRRLEGKYATAQRANKKKQAKRVAAAISNARQDHLHKASAAIAASHSLIVVGNVSGAKLAQTGMAKSVFDASWGKLRQMLSYKAIRHGGIYLEADERWTTQACSACGSVPEGRPAGIAGLRIREWTCGDCGAVHDRDVNAALNILRVGLNTLAEGAAI